MDRGGVFYAQPDGSGVQAVARPVMTPNGIALSPDGQTLYYAETEGARVWAFDVTAPGQVRKDPWPSPQGARMVTASPGGHYQRFDSMAVDAEGNIWTAPVDENAEMVEMLDASRQYQNLVEALSTAKQLMLETMRMK